VFIAIVTVILAASGRLSSTPFPTEHNRLPAAPEIEKPVRTNTAALSTPEMPTPMKPPLAATAPAVSIQPADEPPIESGKDAPSSSSPDADNISEAPVMPDPNREIPPSDALPGKKDVIRPPPPLLLGALRVEKKDTLGLMVKIIYGEFRQRYLDDVLNANPQIGHADTIRVGDIIAFPASPITFDRRPYPLWWLKVEEADSLETAFRRVIGASGNKDAPLIRMIPVWHHQTGMRYGIFVSGYFLNLSTAETMLAQLPAGLSGSAEIITGWPAGTILFGDPFIGKGY
jgi:hypothetical protein